MGASPNTAFAPLVADDVMNERHRQHDLITTGEIPQAVEDPTTDDAYRLGVLMEEVGEVGKAVHERFAIDDLYRELVQVAAVASAWAEGIAAQGWRPRS